MRHRRRGRKLGRNPKHQRALLRSLASALILTRFDEEGLYPAGKQMLRRTGGMLDAMPRVPGRIITTISKAKEVRPYVEKCITLAKKAVVSEQVAEQYEAGADRGTDAWRQWRGSERWVEWNQAIAPALAARRRCMQLLGDKLAVSVLIRDVAPHFVDRPGGYTRIVRLAKPRLGDAGTRAILEFVGVRDRVVEKSQRPTFDGPGDDTAVKPDEAASEKKAESSGASTTDEGKS